MFFIVILYHEGVILSLSDNEKRNSTKAVIMGKKGSKGVESVKKSDRNITPCGEHLKALRESKGMSQEYLGFLLAEVLGCAEIDKGRISKWERGCGMRASVLSGYEQVFNCTNDYLMGKSKSPKRTERQERQQERQRDKKEMQEYMRRHRAYLVQYAAELCDCSVSTYTVANEEIFDIHAEVCADCLGVKDLQGLQWLNYPCTAAEFDLLMGQVDRAIENVFKSFIEMKWHGVTVEEQTPIKEH